MTEMATDVVGIPCLNLSQQLQAYFAKTSYNCRCTLTKLATAIVDVPCQN